MWLLFMPAASEDSSIELLLQNRLLWCGSAPCVQSLPESLLYGGCSPEPQFLVGACFCRSFISNLQLTEDALPAGGYLLCCDPLWATGGQPDPPWSRQSALVPGAALALLLHWPWWLQGCFTLFFFSLVSPNCLSRGVYSFLNLLSNVTSVAHWIVFCQPWDRVGTG